MQLSNDFFSANLALLEKNHPLAWQVVNEHAGQPKGDFCLAENGSLNLRITLEDGEEAFLHDIQRPEAEIEAFYDLVPEESSGVVFFMGMGLGYSPLAMLQSRTHVRHLVILEPEPGVFVQALHALDLSVLLSDKRVAIGLGPKVDVSEITSCMQRALLLESIHLLNHVPSSRINPEAYQELYDEVYKKTNSSNVGGSTTRTFGRKFLENRLRHLSAIHHQHLLEHLKDAFVGVPAFIVAGGPSLNKNIHLLPEAKGKAVIIAVDTVLPALLKHGVTPDFTTTIDMQNIVLEKIVDVSEAGTETSLVCASWVNPSIPKVFPARQVYWTFSARPVEQWINTLLGGSILTSGAGTVAHLSFTTAIMLGCSPIIFVGQDLAYTGQQDHAQHTSLRQKDDLNNLYATNAIIWADGYGGHKVPTTRGWLSDKHHFEWAIAATSDRKFINATEGGVRLEGTEELSMQEALSRYCQQDFDVAALIRTREDIEKMPSRRRMVDEFERMLKTVSGVEKDMERLAVLISKVALEINSLKALSGEYRDFDSLPMNLRRQINEIDVLNNRLDKARPWPLLEEVTMNGLQQSERLRHEIDALGKQPEHYLEYIAKSMDRFILINKCRHQTLGLFKQHLKQLHGYLKKEQGLLQRLEKAGKNLETDHLDLLRLYYGNGDYSLMEKLIAAHCSEVSESAELFFYLGAIAAQQSQFKKAEQCFSRALELGPSWSVKIDECRKRLGDQYYHYAQEWRVMDRDVARRMLVKGLWNCPEHGEIKKDLSAELDQLFEKLAASAAQGALPAMAEFLNSWTRFLSDDNAALLDLVGHERAASLYRYHGNLQVAKQEYGQAATSFAAAIALTPQAPDLHLLLADCAFALGDFVGGVASLDKSVALDRQYAKYWENIGDNFLRKNQPQDAIAAYERCFLALPEYYPLLRKIGDCYKAAGQLQAAEEAYKHFCLKAQAVS